MEPQVNDRKNIKIKRVNNPIRQIIFALKMFLILTIVTGIAYPLFITGIVQVVFPAKANGSLIYKNNNLIGSKLIGQEFDSAIYFTSRPSFGHYSTLPSAGSNYGPTNSKLKSLVSERRKQFIEFNQLDTLTMIPSEMLFASASGLDPHISLTAAKLQVKRITRIRNLDNNEKKKLDQLIRKQTSAMQLLRPDEEIVNVLVLNTELDKLDSNIEYNK